MPACLSNGGSLAYRNGLETALISCTAAHRAHSTTYDSASSTWAAAAAGQATVQATADGIKVARRR